MVPEVSGLISGGGVADCGSPGMFIRTVFRLTAAFPTASRFSMSALKKRWSWSKDLSEFRGLSDRERAGFLLVLEWSRKRLRLTRSLQRGGRS